MCVINKKIQNVTLVQNTFRMIWQDDNKKMKKSLALVYIYITCTKIEKKDVDVCRVKNKKYYFAYQI